jgi:drug/metabolite transporter (DMT)-like permease
MLIAAMAFAAMGSLAHALGPTCNWQIVALARTGLALLFATMLTLNSGVKFVFLRPATLWIRSIAGSISLVCVFYALSHLPVAEVLTLSNVFPIWVAILSWPLLGEAPTLEAWIAIGIGFLGVAVLEQPHFSLDQFVPGHEALPAVLALVGSVTTAIAMLGLHTLQRIHPLAIVVHFSGVATAVCLAMLLLAPNTAVSASRLEPEALGMLLGVGACATVGQVFLTKAFTAGPPAKVSVVALSQAGFAMLLDILVLGHRFSAVTLAGICLVMAPTAWLLWRQGRAQADDL